jgi:hypothetical protein
MQQTQQKVYRCLGEFVPANEEVEAATYHAHKKQGDVARCAKINSKALWCSYWCRTFQSSQRGWMRLL